LTSSIRIPTPSIAERGDHALERGVLEALDVDRADELGFDLRQDLRPQGAVLLHERRAQALRKHARMAAEPQAHEERDQRAEQGDQDVARAGHGWRSVAGGATHRRRRG
jgi:hypothetical protein